MTTVLSVGRTLGRLSGWTLSNLAMQKTLYIADMFQLGRGGNPLFDENFEAWDYGPVVPKLYHKAKMFGAKPVQDIFYEAYLREDHPGMQALKDAYATTKNLSGAKLVSITHWDKGAWAKHYVPDRLGRVIPASDIRQEWFDRLDSEAAAA